MSAFVRLSSKLPGDPETNGVDAMADDLVGNSAGIRYAVVWFDVATITEDVDTGNIVPTIRVRRIEPLGYVNAVDPRVAEVVVEAVEARTGRKAMPFEIVTIGTDNDPDQLTIDDAAS